MKHLLGPDNNFLSLNYFRCKYEIDPRPLSFYGLISAVKSLRTDSNIQDLQNTDHEYEQQDKNFTSQKSYYINI